MVFIFITLKSDDICDGHRKEREGQFLLLENVCLYLKERKDVSERDELDFILRLYIDFCLHFPHAPADIVSKLADFLRFRTHKFEALAIL